MLASEREAAEKHAAALEAAKAREAEKNELPSAKEYNCDPVDYNKALVTNKQNLEASVFLGTAIGKFVGQFLAIIATILPMAGLIIPRLVVKMSRRIRDKRVSYTVTGETDRTGVPFGTITIHTGALFEMLKSKTVEINFFIDLMFALIHASLHRALQIKVENAIAEGKTLKGSYNGNVYSLFFQTIAAMLGFVGTGDYHTFRATLDLDKHTIAAGIYMEIKDALINLIPPIIDERGLSQAPEAKIREYEVKVFKCVQCNGKLTWEPDKAPAPNVVHCGCCGSKLPMLIRKEKRFVSIDSL
jgi:hypothetical protein